LQIDANRDLAWSFKQTHWDKVKTFLTPEMGSALVGSARSFCSAAARDDVQSFFTAHPVPAAETELKHAIEGINGCIEMRRLQEPRLRQWLAERGKP
jgi:aminopeptidase N/puromycin-sensitive aminopeptidase